MQASQEEDDTMAVMDIPEFPPRDVVHDDDPWAASRSAKSSRGKGGKRAVPAAAVQPGPLIASSTFESMLEAHAKR
eukprot:2088608-Karenia_brevis.AAC.1